MSRKAVGWEGSVCETHFSLARSQMSMQFPGAQPPVLPALGPAARGSTLFLCLSASKCWDHRRSQDGMMILTGLGKFYHVEKCGSHPDYLILIARFDVSCSLLWSYMSAPEPQQSDVNIMSINGKTQIIKLNPQLKGWLALGKHQ